MAENHLSCSTVLSLRFFDDCGTQGNRLFYLSTAPSLVETISTQLRAHGLTSGRGWDRLVVEKPFGRVQNHMMQLLALVGMETPISLNAEQIRNEKVKVLQALRPIREHDVTGAAVCAQYGRGYAEGMPVKGYREEDGVSPQSGTETFACVKLAIDSWRWSGVPFYLRHGKRLAKKGTEISVYFKKSPDILFNAADSDTPVDHNVLTIRVQPDEGVSLRMEAKAPGQVLQIQSVKMDFRFGDDSPQAYERLLLDTMIGDATLFICHDEAEHSWMFFDPILSAWRNEDARRVPQYPAGTWGPKEADLLLAQDGRQWRRL